LSSGARPHGRTRLTTRAPSAQMQFAPSPSQSSRRTYRMRRLGRPVPRVCQRRSLQWLVCVPTSTRTAPTAPSVSVRVVLAGALRLFWLTRGYLTEGTGRLEDLFSTDEQPTAARAKALDAAALLGSRARRGRRTAAHPPDRPTPRVRAVVRLAAEEHRHGGRSQPPCSTKHCTARRTARSRRSFTASGIKVGADSVRSMFEPAARCHALAAASAQARRPPGDADA
jgi:hypothetical protein